MNARTFSLTALAAAVLCVGLGADAPKEEKKKERSPWAGEYTGTYTASNPQGDQEGDITLSIDENGNSTGESQAKGNDQKAILKGKHLKNNKAVIVIEMPDGSKANGYGTVSRLADGGITGTMIQRFGTQVVGGLEFELHPKKADKVKEEKAKEEKK
jgi:hypothetical protein